METFLLISAIIITLIVLIKVHRFNHNLARYIATDTKVYSGGQPLYLMNTAGKWLTFAGGIATDFFSSLSFLSFASAIFTPS